MNGYLLCITFQRICESQLCNIFPSFCHLFREILDTVMNIDYYFFIQTSSIQFGGIRIFLPHGSIKTRKIDKLHKDIWTIASLHVYNLFNIYHSQKESTHFGLKITALYRVLAHFEPKIDKDFFNYITSSCISFVSKCADTSKIHFLQDELAHSGLRVLTNFGLAVLGYFALKNQTKKVLTKFIKMFKFYQVFMETFMFQTVLTFSIYYWDIIFQISI